MHTSDPHKSLGAALGRIPSGVFILTATRDGVLVTAGGRVLPWRRDDVDMYTIHLEIPPGISQLEVALDFLKLRDAARGLRALRADPERGDQARPGARRCRHQAR